jgi:hypothetical protein
VTSNALPIAAWVAVTFATWLVSRLAPDGVVRDFADRAWRVQAVAMLVIFTFVGFGWVMFG